MAASCSWSVKQLPSGGWVYTAAIVAHTDGAVASVASQDVYGSIVRVVSDPGATAPTAAWDFQLTGPNGESLIAATGDNRSATASEQLVPSVPIVVAGAVTVAAQNMGSGGQASIVLYVDP